MMNMFIKAFLFLAANGLWSSALAAPAETPATTPVKILSLTWSGNGCPGVSDAQAAVQVEKGKIILTVSNYTGAEIGPGISPIEKTKNCALHINMAGGSPGWNLVLTTVTAEGMWSGDPDTTLTTFSTVFVSQDASNTSTGRTSRKGKGGDLEKFTFVDDVDFSLGCLKETGSLTSILNVNWRASFTSTSAEATGELVSTPETPFTLTMGFAYLPCD